MHQQTCCSASFCPAITSKAASMRGIAILAMAAMLLIGPRLAAQGCTPFGNVPRGDVSAVKPSCFGGTLLGPWLDSDGTPRFSCRFLPEYPVAGTKYPLIVWLHPSLLTADSVNLTPIGSGRDNVNISGGSTAGYIILAPEGRNTEHFYPFPDNQGTGWDNWYRQVSPKGDVTINSTVFKENVDAATIDHFIQDEIATGRVDTNRIYLVGWSNGSSMAFLYGANRNNIAAAAVYSAPDPFGALEDPCQQTPIAGTSANNTQLKLVSPGLPTFHVHNACDIVALCPNMEKIAGQLKGAGGVIEEDEIIAFGQQVDACFNSCGTNPNGDPDNLEGLTVGAANHGTWPVNQTPQMLQFLQQHPLSARPRP